MKNYNNFFKKKKITLFDVLNILKLKKNITNKNIIFDNIKELNSASSNQITFLNSSKYKDEAAKTKAKYIITHTNYANFLPKSCIPIIVKNVFTSVSKVTNLFYPNAVYDDLNTKLKKLTKNNKFIKLKFGNNILMGSNIKLGSNCTIGHNSIIENNVVIGNNCKIGSNVIIRNSIIGNNVNILDGSIIGKKGFGFFPESKNNVRYPHIGIVIIGNNVEIGCNNVIDRGSLSNTVIGDNTFLDNHVHIAHNVKIGKNCIITAQVGFAGSSIIGDNVMIGGQAGISGHLKIGNNVKIGGGSGVIKNIADNSKVMGYPAKDVRIFLKENK
tara:strand:+ start:256 stop:1239 length:984 start_codon:yes stop_codon:yes gene_type:complete